MLKRLFLLLSFVIQLPCIAQIEYFEINGYVVDAESRLPISGVLIIDSIGQSATLSNENGTFNLTVLDSSNIVFSHISFEKYSLSSTVFLNQIVDTVRMTPFNEQLEEIILRKGDYAQFKRDFLALEKDSFETNIIIPGVKQYKGPINLTPGGTGESGSFIFKHVSNLINPKRRENNRVNRWMKKIKKRQEK